MQIPGQPPFPQPAGFGAPPMPPDTSAPPQFAQAPNMLPQAMGGQPMQAAPEVHDPQSQMLAQALSQLGSHPAAAQTPAGAGVLADMLNKMHQNGLMHPQGSPGITVSPDVSGLPGMAGMGAPSALDGTGVVNQVGMGGQPQQRSGLLGLGGHNMDPNLLRLFGGG